MTNKTTRMFSPEDLKVLCPIMMMMHSLELSGLVGLRVTRDAEGCIAYIITIYEKRLRDQKNAVVDAGANI